MNDDLERQLDEFYRKLDGPARRVEARWKSTPAGDSRRIQAWLAAGVAAAAAILLMISALRSDPRPVERPVVKAEPPEELPLPRPVEPPPLPTPIRPKPAPVEQPRPIERPRPPEIRPEPAPTPETPKPILPTPPAPERKPEPPKPTESAPRPARAVASIRET